MLLGGVPGRWEAELQTCGKVLALKASFKSKALVNKMDRTLFHHLKRSSTKGSAGCGGDVEVVMKLL